MNNNSSFHGLNSDNGLSLTEMIYWLFLNLINNKYFPNSYDSDLKLKNFRPIIDRNILDKLDHSSSPSRAFCDLFWMMLDWTSINKELGEIKIFDTGCGSGEYALLLQDYSGSKISKYTGIDSHPQKEWDKLMKDNDYINVMRDESQEIQSQIPSGSNLFITQSAIEHFEEDLLYF